MPIDPANLILYIFVLSILNNLFHMDLLKFINMEFRNPWTTNDCNEFLTSFKKIYSKELELKVEHQFNHASCLHLDISK